MRTLLVPFQIDSRGGLATTDDAAVIVKQQIIDILATADFEREMRPQHGAGVPNILFSPVINSILATKADEVRRRLEAALTLGRIVSVSMYPTPNARSSVSLDVKYTVSPSPTVYEVRHTVTGLVTDETPWGDF